MHHSLARPECGEAHRRYAHARHLPHSNGGSGANRGRGGRLAIAGRGRGPGADQQGPRDRALAESSQCRFDVWPETRRREPPLPEARIQASRDQRLPVLALASGAEDVAQQHEEQRRQRKAVDDLVPLDHGQQLRSLEPPRRDDLARIGRLPPAHWILREEQLEPLVAAAIGRVVPDDVLERLRRPVSRFFFHFARGRRGDGLAFLDPTRRDRPDVLVDDEPVLADEEKLVSATDDDADGAIREIDGVVRRRRAVGLGHFLKQHAEPGIPRERVQQLDFPSVAALGHGCETSITTMRSSWAPTLRRPCVPPGWFRTTSPGPTSNSRPSSIIMPLPEMTT